MNYRVEDSYLYDLNSIKEKVAELYENGDLGKSRTVKSYVKEWYAHNILYKLGLFQSHTKDVDLNDDEKTGRLIAYNIIWILCWVIRDDSGEKTHEE